MPKIQGISPWARLEQVWLAHEILRIKKTIALSQHICSNCNFAGPEEDNTLGYVLSAGQSVINSTSQWINALEYPSFGQKQFFNRILPVLVATS